MAKVEDMIIGQPRIKDYTTIFQVECPDCKTNFQVVGLIGASAKCSGVVQEKPCPCAFLVNGPARINPNYSTGDIDVHLPLQLIRLGPDGRPL